MANKRPQRRTLPPPSEIGTINLWLPLLIAIFAGVFVLVLDRLTDRPQVFIVPPQQAPAEPEDRIYRGPEPAETYGPITREEAESEAENALLRVGPRP